MKDYYSILGVDSLATEATIKRRYRQLALQYHPDKNKSAEAEQIIKDINEAYDVIGDPEKRRLYDLRLTGTYVPVEEPPPTPRHRDPRYRPKSAEYIRQVRENSFSTYMRNNLKYMILISKMTFGFALLCLTDFALPSKHEVQEVVSTSKTRSGNKTVGSFILFLENGSQIKLSHELDESFVEGDLVDYYTSIILSIPVKVANKRTHFSTRVPLSFFGNFLFFPIILVATSALGIFYQGEGVEFRFNVGLFNLIFFFFNLYFLNVHR